MESHSNFIYLQILYVKRLKWTFTYSKLTIETVLKDVKFVLLICEHTRHISFNSQRNKNCSRQQILMSNPSFETWVDPPPPPQILLFTIHKFKSSNSHNRSVFRILSNISRIILAKTVLSFGFYLLHFKHLTGFKMQIYINLNSDTFRLNFLKD